MKADSSWQDDSRGRLTSEDDFLALVDRYFPAASGHFPYGRGHDCAELVDLPSGLALSTDMFLEGTHFTRAYFTPSEAGGKALTAAVSDLAAAGARPLGFSLGVTLPDPMPVAAAEGLLQGMAAKAAAYGMVLTGGDIVKGDRLGFSLCVWGGSACGGNGFLRRKDALPGDAVFLAGQAGLARVGLFVLETVGRAAARDWPHAVSAHLDPTALLREGGRIARIAHMEAGARISLMDVSDGIARDLPRLVAPHGAELDLAAVGLHPELTRAAAFMQADPEDIFLAGGEDYALLGTCPEEVSGRLQAALPELRFIGRVTGRPGICRKDGRSMPDGFDHFGHLHISEPDNGTPGMQGCAVRPEQSGSTARLDARVLSFAVDRLIRLGREAHRAGLMAGFNGNISCRLSLGSGSYCLITRSGSAKGRLEACDFLLLPLQGGEPVRGLLPPCPSGPSSESPLHLALYAAAPDSRVILHAHPPKLLALSLLAPEDDLLRLPLPEAERYGTMLGRVPFHPPGGTALADAVAAEAVRHPAVWMQRHGIVVHGRDEAGVLGLCEELEQLASIQLALTEPA